MPPKATKKQAKNLAEALARGDKNRGTIALTMGREALDEVLFPASSYGYVGRLKDALGIGSGKEEEK